MDSCTIHSTPSGLLVESDQISAIISEKDFPLLSRGQPVPLRDEKTRVTAGRGNYALTRLGDLVIYMGKTQFTLSGMLWHSMKTTGRTIVLSCI